MTTRTRFRISGTVQGVGYRAWAQQQAHELVLGGWVRNRRDGTVEAEVVGPSATVAAYVARCHQGPRYADVASVVVEVEAEEPVGAPAAVRFEIRPTK